MGIRIQSSSLFLSRHFILVEIICANQSETKFTKIWSNLYVREIKKLLLLRKK